MQEFYDESLQWEPHPCFTTAAVVPIFNRDIATVGFDNLAGESETDASATLLGGEERHEQVGTVHDAGTFVAHEDVHPMSIAFPAHRDRARGFERGVHGILHQVDEQLIE